MEELIELAQKGNKEAFTHIILSMKEDLYKIARTRISNEEDIEDAIQETMIETYRSIKKLKDIKKLKMWIVKILINKCNRVYRRKYKKDVSLDEFEIESFSSSNDYLKVEDRMNFYLLLKDLKYEERIIVILYYKEQYSIKEIAKILKIKENTIKTHLSRARQKIKVKYQRGNQIGTY